MSFDSVSAFLEMGGHGLYVWLCYSVGLITFLMLGFSPVFERKALMKELAQRQRRNAAQTSSNKVKEET